MLKTLLTALSQVTTAALSVDTDFTLRKTNKFLPCSRAQRAEASDETDSALPRRDPDAAQAEHQDEDEHRRARCRCCGHCTRSFAFPQAC